MSNLVVNLQYNSSTEIDVPPGWSANGYKCGYIIGSGNLQYATISNNKLVTDYAYTSVLNGKTILGSFNWTYTYKGKTYSGTAAFQAVIHSANVTALLYVTGTYNNPYSCWTGKPDTTANSEGLIPIQAGTFQCPCQDATNSQCPGYCGAFTPALVSAFEFDQIMCKMLSIASKGQMPSPQEVQYIQMGAPIYQGQAEISQLDPIWMEKYKIAAMVSNDVVLYEYLTGQISNPPTYIGPYVDPSTATPINIQQLVKQYPSLSTTQRKQLFNKMYQIFANYNTATIALWGNNLRACNTPQEWIPQQVGLGAWPGMPSTSTTYNPKTSVTYGCSMSLRTAITNTPPPAELSSLPWQTFTINKNGKNETLYCLYQYNPLNLDPVYWVPESLDGSGSGSGGGTNSGGGPGSGGGGSIVNIIESNWVPIVIAIVIIAAIIAYAAFRK